MRVLQLAWKDICDKHREAVTKEGQLSTELAQLKGVVGATRDAISDATSIPEPAQGLQKAWNDHLRKQSEATRARQREEDRLKDDQAQLERKVVVTRDHIKGGFAQLRE